MYEYPQGSAWDFLLHALGKNKISTLKDQIEKSYFSYIMSTEGTPYFRDHS